MRNIFLMQSVSSFWNFEISKFWNWEIVEFNYCNFWYSTIVTMFLCGSKNLLHLAMRNIPEGCKKEMKFFYFSFRISN